MGFDGKSILISGGAGGMGLAIARRFARDGARILLADIQATSEFPCIEADLTRVDECRRAVQATVSRHGGMDMLIHAAGLWWEGPSQNMPEDAYDRLFDVNLKAAYFLSAAAIAHLERTQGQIIHIASDAGLMGNAGAAAYCASKGGLVLLAKALALELAPKGVRVNAVCPCDVETPMLDKQAADSGDPAQYREALKRFYPQGARTRFARPEEVAEFIHAIAGIEAITGAALQIDFATTAGK